jgi:type VI secretion system secreted protein VgrG
MATLTRPIKVISPLGDGVLLFRQMTANEELGRLSLYELEVLSEDREIKFDDILGHDMTVTLELEDGSLRYFHGYVSEFRYVGDAGIYVSYQATLRPWLWFLTRTSDCRIFSEKTVPDIIKQVFTDHGFDGAVEDKLTGSYRTWVYCVQYRETDFNFVSRLMEQEGIYYYFTHENGKHTMVLCDSYSAHDAFPGYEEIKSLSSTDAVKHHTDSIFGWEVGRSVQSGNYALTDYDFEKPKAGLAVQQTIDRGHARPDYEIFDYPGEYSETDDGQNYVTARIEELQSEYERVHGNGNARGLNAGWLFSLTDCAREDQNREYLVVSAQYSMQDTAYESGSAAEGSGFEVSFEGMDASEPFRPERISPKPLVQGPQTAIVVGGSGEEIWTDEYGRVKVQFHWDREGKADENSSCWIRVAQVWAGKKWGAMYIPRIGQEVIVEFLEGDPDRPIVTGRVYNAENMPPYDLPDNKTMSTLKSNSSKGGQGFNEIRFEDKKGEEQIFIHGEKNLDIHIKNDRFEFIGNDRHLNVKGKQAVKIEDSLSVEVANDVAEVYKANHSEEVSDDYFLKGTNLVIEGSTNITLKVGQSFIEIESGGVKIGTTGDIELDAKGNVKTTAAMNAEMKGAAGAKVEGAMVDVKASGVATIEGSVVKIN